MGAGFYGGIKNTKGATFNSFIKSSFKKNNSLKENGTIYQNAVEAAKNFKYENGLFGEKNRNPKRVPREIFSKNPSTTAALFFNSLKQGAIQTEVFNTSHGKGIKAKLRDGSIITYRPFTSSKGSPAVEIVVSESKIIKAKKYHIVKEERNESNRV